MATTPGKRVPLSRDERGVAYGIRPDGRRFYVAAAPRYDPATRSVVRGDPGSQQGFFTNQDWNPDTGQYDASTNWHNVIGLGTLGAIAAPAALGAAGVGGAAAGGTTSVIPGTGIPVVAGTGAGVTAPAAAAAATAGAAGGTGGGMTFGQYLLREGIGQGVQAGLNIYGQRQAARGSREASELELQGLREQLQFQRELEARRRDEFDRSEQASRLQYETDQARRAPYRQTLDAFLRQAAGHYGWPEPAPYSPPTMPRQEVPPGGPMLPPPPGGPPPWQQQHGSPGPPGGHVFQTSGSPMTGTAPGLPGTYSLAGGPVPGGRTLYDLTQQGRR